MTQNILEVSHVSKSYGGHRALDDVSLCIGRGEIYGLLGVNGAGKTTLLRIIATLLSKDSGTVLVCGENVDHAPNRVRSHITYLPDEAGAYRSMTGREYLRFMATLYEKQNEQQLACLERGIKVAKLGSAIDQKIRSYSRGMTRRLVLARTIMAKPSLAILDEPTSGLDVLNSLDIRRTIAHYAREYGIAFLLSSHHLLEVSHFATRCGILYDGHLLAQGSPQELMEQNHARSLEEAFEKVVNGV